MEISSPGLAELRQGLLKSVRIRIPGGEIGDFRYTNPGLPLRTLDVTFGDLVVDVARLDEGELAPARMGAVTLAELVLDARAHSTTHWNGGTTIKTTCVCTSSEVRSGRNGSVDPRQRLRFASAWHPDPWRRDSDNLWFELTSLRVSGLRLPVAHLLQLVLRSFSPAIDPDKFSGRNTSWARSDSKVSSSGWGRASATSLAPGLEQACRRLGGPNRVS